MEKASVSVKIYNSTYALTTSASEEQVLKIAAEVDRRMHYQNGFMLFSLMCLRH